MEQKEFRYKLFNLILLYESTRRDNKNSLKTHVEDIGLLIDKILELIEKN